MQYEMALDILYLCLYASIVPSVLSMLVLSLAAIAFYRRNKEIDPASGADASRTRRFMMVIPAHDEEMTITETVRSCLAVNYPGALFEVLVIADNCTDATAARARGAGARVLERFDADKKSKGHAIEYLIENLEASGEFDTLDAIVVVDADATVDPNILDQFALGLGRGSLWMQCYDCVGNPDQSWRTRIMAHGFSLFNGIALAGRQALGLSACLRGNGMCLSTAGLKRVPWKAHGLVEDIEYSWTVRIAGGRIDFIDQTAVRATMLAKGGSPLAHQRRRWEYGRSDIRRRMLGPVLRSANISPLRKAADVIELMSLPTSLVALVYVVLTVMAAIAVTDMLQAKEFVRIAIIAVLHFVTTLALVVHAISPFVTGLLPWRFVVSLGYVPYYIVWKLVVLAPGRPKRWIRTAREVDPHASAGIPLGPLATGASDSGNQRYLSRTSSTATKP